MIVASRPTVDQTPTLIADNAVSDPGNPGGVGISDAGTKTFWIQNVTGSSTVYLDGTNAVAANAGAGWDPLKTAELMIELEPGEQLWGVLAAGAAPQSLHVLKGGR
jgi:hypothetical protein